MDQNYHNGMSHPYNPNARHPYHAGNHNHTGHNNSNNSSLPNLNAQVPESSQYPPHTLPPLNSRGPAYLHTEANNPNYEHLQRTQQPLYAGSNASFPAYTSSGAYSYATQMVEPMMQHSAHPAPFGHDQSGQSQLQPLRPMPSGVHGMSMQLPPSQVYGGAALSSTGYDQSRSQVVGSQGRRGVLPSDEGRPAAVPSDGGSSAVKGQQLPTKDADGKFPCPHCNKTYLHAKHLKRHMLRHTGDRPYSCCLCNDTFSRSDILKRHFQKCSIRRGNPTGATHLSNSQNHLKRQQTKRSSPESSVTSPADTLMGGDGHFSSGENTIGLANILDSPQSMSTPNSRSDTNRSYAENMSVRGQRSNTNPAPMHMTRMNFPSESSSNINMAPSLPSTGTSTPITPRGSGQFSVNGSHEVLHQKFGYGPSMGAVPTYNRHSMPVMVNPGHLDANGYDWSIVPVKQDGGHQDGYMHGSFVDTSYTNGAHLQE